MGKFTFLNLKHKWEPTDTYKNFGKESNAKPCNLSSDLEPGNTDNYQQSIELQDHQDQIRPEDLDIKPNKASLCIELLSEGGQEKLIPPRVLYMVSQRIKVLTKPNVQDL